MSQSQKKVQFSTSHPSSDRNTKGLRVNTRLHHDPKIGGTIASPIISPVETPVNRKSSRVLVGHRSPNQAKGMFFRPESTRLESKKSYVRGASSEVGSKKAYVRGASSEVGSSSRKTRPSIKSSSRRELFSIKSSHSTPKKRNTIGEYSIVRTLGKGSQAIIKLGIHPNTGKKVAIKVLSKLSANKIQFQREALALKLLRHKHIISLEDAYESSKYMFLVLEYCPGGDLFDYVIKKDGLERKECLQLFSQVVRAVMYSHKNGVIHRDIKPENILLDGNGRAVLTDFGLCGVCANDGRKTLCGSPHYASPELCKGSKYNFTSDSWSLGVLLYTMSCASYPFEHKNINKLINKIVAGKYDIPKKVSVDIAELIQQLLVVDPARRLPVDKIYESSCFYKDETNLYFSKEDLQPLPAGSPIPKKDVSDVMIRCLSMMGWGHHGNIRELLSQEPRTIVQKRIQNMYRRLKVTGH